MGTSCTRVDKDSDTEQEREKTSDSPLSKLRKKSRVQAAQTTTKIDLVLGHYVYGADTKLDSLAVGKDLIYERAISNEKSSADGFVTGKQDEPEKTPSRALRPEEAEREYFRDREVIVNRGRSLGVDWRITHDDDTTEAEHTANRLLEIVRHNDEIVFYSDEKLQGYGGQKHRRFAGDHFLTNVDLIGTTALFAITKQMPKGSHLHIHFNSTLLPHVLLDIAVTTGDMYISSNIPLTSAVNLDCCEIQFLVRKQGDVREERELLLQEERSRRGGSDLNIDKLEAERCNPFHDQYLIKGGRGQWMEFNLFRKKWEEIQNAWGTDSQLQRFVELSMDETWPSRNWLISKLVFNEHETYNIHQTSEGAWEKFDGRTRMMKGLFNYEKAFKKYTQECLKGFVEDNIQYAEIRPNFMKANQILSDDGATKLDNRATMDLIVKEWEEFDRSNPRALAGLKVIYCTPRSFSTELVQESLDECLEFKTGSFGKYIAGFDLVGPEFKGHPLKYFIPQFLEFKRKCRDAGVKVPFLFHCGETLELGTDTDGNLIDALLLDSKRIGHGFALARKPYLISEFKKRNICLEVCPISNEVLGLTPRMSGHAMYDLLANNVHCTVSSDNGTLFKSTLSHDFYQVLVGSQDMNLYGWKQLIEWSIEHASLTDLERSNLVTMWTSRWAEFIGWVNTEFNGIKRIAMPQPEQKIQRKDVEAEEQAKKMVDEEYQKKSGHKYIDTESKEEFQARIEAIWKKRMEDETQRFANETTRFPQEKRAWRHIVIRLQK